MSHVDIPDAVLKAHGLLTDAEILEKNPCLNPTVLDLDPAIGISDDALVHAKFLLQQGCTEDYIAQEYPEYTRFIEALEG